MEVVLFDRGHALSLFMDRVKPAEACWIWIGNYDKKTKTPRLLFRYPRSVTLQASRLAFALFNGTVFHGKLICHTCDNPSCVNPAHLFQGTQVDNMRDAISKGRKDYTGESNANVKLTNEQVRSIRNDERTQREIAEDFNITQVCVSLIKRGKSWTHLR